MLRFFVRLGRVQRWLRAAAAQGLQQHTRVGAGGLQPMFL